MAQPLSDNLEQTQNDPDGSGGFFPQIGMATDFNNTAMPAPGVAQYIQSLIYRIPELHQLVEAQGVTLQNHSEILGHTQGKYNELAAQLSELVARVARLEKEEGETSEQTPAHATLAKDVKSVQREVENLRGQLSELQGKAVQYERTLMSRGTVDPSPGSQSLPSRPKLPVQQATGSEIPKAPSSMRQPNQPRSAQEIDAMNNRLVELVQEAKGVQKGQSQTFQGHRNTNKSATMQSNQLVKQHDKGKLVVRANNTLAEGTASRNKGFHSRSHMVSECRERILRTGRAQLEEYCGRYDKELVHRGSGTRSNDGCKFIFSNTRALYTNMGYWNGRIVNALDQLSMAGREMAAVDVVSQLVEQMERYGTGAGIKFNVPGEGIQLIKSWLTWTDELFEELRRLNLLKVPGVCSTAISKALQQADERKTYQPTNGVKRRMESPLPDHSNAKRHVPSSFDSPNKRRAASPPSSPFSASSARKGDSDMLSTGSHKRHASDLFSTGNTKKNGAEVFRSFTKRRALSPQLSDAEIARRHADSFLKNLDLQQLQQNASTNNSPQSRGSRTEPRHGSEYHRESDHYGGQYYREADYYGPGSDIKGDFYPDGPIHGRDYRRGGYM
ncbi:hypothetical protein HDK77DRAFT_182765 [Phyllosticta capitalensis]